MKKSELRETIRKEIRNIFEQGTITCYGCQNGQIVTNSNMFFNSNMQGPAGPQTVCGITSTGGVTTTWYGNQNDPALANCGGTGNQTSGSMCSNGVSQQALQAFMPNASNPQLGDHGITQNFVNNMANRSTQFYNSRAVTLGNKAIQLNGGTGQMFCNGKNPMWQASLMLRKIYAEQCRDNPGTC